MPIQPQNKKFLAQKQKEERQKRIILYSTIAVLVIVLGLVTYGVLDRYVFKPRTPIIQIEGDRINAVEFEQRVRYERFRLINQMAELINFTQSLGGTPETFAYFQPQINQIITELQQPALIGQRVIEALTEELIILEEAKKMGIEVNEEIIDQEIQSIFGYFPEGTPTPEATLEPQPTSTLTSLQKTLIPPTATLTATEAVQEEGQEEEVSLTATQTPADEEAGEEKLDPTATPLLQPTEYTEDLYQQNYQQAMQNLESEAQIKEKTFRNLVKIFYLREQVIEDVTENIERTQEQVRARHILVEEQETADDLYQRLQEGDSFADLAREFSTDTFSAEQGGDLGWFGRGMMTAPFEEAAYDLEIGQISQPVETDFGWHIIQVLGKEERPIDQETYNRLKNQAYNEWLQDKKTEYNAQVNEEWTQYVPQEPAIPQEIFNYIQIQQQQLQQQQQQQQQQPAPTPESDQ